MLIDDEYYALMPVPFSINLANGTLVECYLTLNMIHDFIALARKEDWRSYDLKLPIWYRTHKNTGKLTWDNWTNLPCPLNQCEILRFGVMRVKHNSTPIVYVKTVEEEHLILTTLKNNESSCINLKYNKNEDSCTLY